jgi:hypothetical protein
MRHIHRKVRSAVTEQVALRYEFVAEVDPLCLELVELILSGLPKLSVTVDAAVDGDVRDVGESGGVGIAAPVCDSFVLVGPGPKGCLRNKMRSLGNHLVQLMRHRRVGYGS